MSRYFTYRSLEDLRVDIVKHGVDIRLEENVERLLEPIAIGGRTVGNRMAIHPMEGCDGTLDGRPDHLTFRRWERFGAGGAKLIWGEATAVVAEGRANPRQLLISDATVADFERLQAKTRRAHRERFGRDDDLLVGLQLTHSGRWSHPNPLIARRSRVLDPIKHLDSTSPLLDDAYLERLAGAYARGARLARDAGFDFVDIKQCHTYLLNELLAARHRDGPYGGSFENRTRLLREVIAAINSECGDRLMLASRLNVYDGPRYHAAIGERGEPDPEPENTGWGTSEVDGISPDLHEPIRLVSLLGELGVRLINVTLGSPYFNSHIGRPFERAPVDGYDSPEHPLVGVERHFRLATEIQRSSPEITVVGTGYSWLRHYAAFAGEANVRDGRISVMGLGRGALAYPDFAADLMERGEMDDRKACIGVSYCTALMRAKNNDLGQFPAGCVPRDTLYAEQFKLAQGR
jgi:2,4-dienoyl-CoA reductase-like NADH-dependent reductase (Old Yellow Enzyme family)